MTEIRRAALITGAKGGIGSCLTKSFRDSGYFVVATDVAEIGDVDCDEFIAADIATICKRDESMDAFRNQVMQACGERPLSVLVNNAAVQIVKPSKDLDYADWTVSFDTNLIAPAQLIRTFASDLERAGGSVVNISSVHAKATKRGFACYATTKSALVGLTKALAVELGGRVRVNAICPAAVNTRMLRQGFGDDADALGELASYHPIGRIAEPREVGSVVLFLASPEASYVTGSVVDVDGAILSLLNDPGAR